METKSFMKKSLANKSVVERVVDQITAGRQAPDRA